MRKTGCAAPTGEARAPGRASPEGAGPREPAGSGPSPPVRRQHFPFFRTAPEGWKNTVRHNLCFRDSFEKVPAARAGWPRACLWRLTAEGRRRFRAEARALAAAQRARIRQCMSRPGAPGVCVCVCV